MFIASSLLTVALQRTAMCLWLSASHVAPDGAMTQYIIRGYKHFAPPEQLTELT